MYLKAYVGGGGFYYYFYFYATHREGPHSFSSI